MVFCSNATFHRLLVVSGKNHLMLTPVSFITINYINESKQGLADAPVNSSPDSSSWYSTPHTYLKSISKDFQCSENTLRRFCCKVVVVHTVILGGSSDLHEVPGDNYLALANVSIPVAGFILESYCYWSYGEKAAKLLRLHEELPFIPPHQRSWYGLEKNKNPGSTSLRQKMILDMHKMITVKSYGSFSESLFQDLFFVSHKFPIRPKISGDSLISHGAGFFAEAMILPWDMYPAKNDNDTLSNTFPVEKRKRCCLDDGLPNKRGNADCASNIFSKVESVFNNKNGGFELRSCDK